MVAGISPNCMHSSNISLISTILCWDVRNSDEGNKAPLPLQQLSSIADSSSLHAHCLPVGICIHACNNIPHAAVGMYTCNNIPHAVQTSGSLPHVYNEIVIVWP